VAAAFPSDFKELVRSRTDIVALINESVALQPQRGGQIYVGLCPFHDDHNPSMQVNPDRQSYKCWSCGEGGDCFSYVMKMEGIGFREALEALAERVHLEMPKSIQRSGTNQNAGSVYDVVAWARNEFHHCLMTDPAAQRARDYLKDRKFSEQSVRQFQIGYHPDSWTWLIDKARGRFSEKQLFQANLVKEKRNQPGYRDNFMDRVLFPISDERGRPVAFGGRILPGGSWADAPKYINSDDTEIFSKSNLLYGLDKARDAIRQTKAAIVMEGYTDCTFAFQYGIENAVATLGTSLTDQHVRLLKRFTQKVIVVYDGDTAGQTAAERALAKILPHDIDLRILTLPEEADPADYLDQHGAEAFQNEVDNAPDAWEFKYRTLRERYGENSVNTSQQIITEMLELLAITAKLAGSAKEDLLIGRLVQRFRVNESNLRRRLGEMRERNTQQSQVNSTQPASSAQRNGFDEQSATPRKYIRLEEELLEIILCKRDALAEIRGELDAEDLSLPQHRELYLFCCKLADAGVVPSYESVMSALEDPALKKLVVHLDTQTTTHGLEIKLNENGSYTQSVVQQLHWRHQERKHESMKDQYAIRIDTSEGLASAEMDMLRQASAYHSQRVQRKYPH